MKYTVILSDHEKGCETTWEGDEIMFMVSYKNENGERQASIRSDISAHVFRECLLATELGKKLIAEAIEEEKMMRGFEP